jgi:ABC-type uncharacterized transport system permease subunit
MARKIFSVIAGYLAMWVFMFIVLSILYKNLGADGSFEKGTFIVSGTWVMFSILISFIASVDGGWVCMLISKSRNAALLLAGIVLVIGLIMSVPKLGEAKTAVTEPRIGSVSNMDAMNKAKEPDFVLILNPIISAIGIFLGSGIVKEHKEVG